MICIDAGANVGEFSNYILNIDKTIITYAIEPNPYLAQQELASLAIKYKGRLFIKNFAIGKLSGTENLSTSQVFNSQIASVLPINIEAPWHPMIKQKLYEQVNDDKLTTRVVSVETFCRDLKLDYIDILKIDIQGMDLLVYEEFLKYCEIGVAIIEVDTADSFYLGTENNFTELARIVSKYNLNFLKVIPNNSDLTEFNVFVSKNSKNGIELVNSFKLLDCQIFGRYSKVIGIAKLDSEEQLFGKILKKVFTSFKHPVQSIESALLKLTR